jgi:hypothetical protein
LIHLKKSDAPKLIRKSMQEQPCFEASHVGFGIKNEGAKTNVDSGNAQKIWVQKQTLPGHGCFAHLRNNLSCLPSVQPLIFSNLGYMSFGVLLKKCAAAPLFYRGDPLLWG